MINEFKGKNHFLSNFSDSEFELEGMKFKNAEAAFQSFKNLKRQKEFLNLNPSAAKKLGRSVELRDDWDEVKDHIMYKVVRAKFTSTKELMDKLIATGDAHLEEGNNWNDKYWGTSKGIGENMLGRILMLVRTHVKNQQRLLELAIDQLPDKEYEVIMDILTQPDTGE